MEEELSLYKLRKICKDQKCVGCYSMTKKELKNVLKTCPKNNCSKTKDKKCYIKGKKCNPKTAKCTSQDNTLKPKTIILKLEIDLYKILNDNIRNDALNNVLYDHFNNEHIEDYDDKHFLLEKQPNDDGTLSCNFIFTYNLEKISLKKLTLFQNNIQSRISKWNKKYNFSIMSYNVNLLFKNSSFYDKIGIKI